MELSQRLADVGLAQVEEHERRLSTSSALYTALYKAWRAGRDLRGIR